MAEVIRVFLVDDHQIVLDGLKSLFGETDIYVSGTARNGQEAFEKLASDPFFTDVVLTDISMPVVSGTELCRMVKNHIPHLKVLILSMYSTLPLVKEAVAAEADGFVLKTAGRDELLTALHRVFNHSTYYSSDLIPIIQEIIRGEKRFNENLNVLTAREVEILRWILKEYTSEQIALELNISKRTVDNHRLHILQKTGSKGTIGLVKFALKAGLLDG
ncbi:MAG: response regulator transcription factor [Flavobacteriales bacterium]|nr:response regulator transcription factor [Flavobacteriales bacterium]MCX7650344.1 response regulator transcription factor [Flavobacteriales bacterium]MDW8431622.1 response regulator transcription factor [Flavobacteriales bacterium]